MDELLSDTERNFYIDWYEAVDISLVWIKNEFFYEGFFNSDILHDEDFDPTIETDDDTIKVSNVSNVV